MIEDARTPSVRLVGLSSGTAEIAAGANPSRNPSSPAPLYVTQEQVALIEGWASNAATHGNLEAWGVLSQCLLWRTNQ